MTVVLLIAGQTLRSQTPSREACLSRLLQGVRQQVQIHLARQREAQGHDQGCDTPSGLHGAQTRIKVLDCRLRYRS